MATPNFDFKKEANVKPPSPTFLRINDVQSAFNPTVFKQETMEEDKQKLSNATGQLSSEYNPKYDIDPWYNVTRDKLELHFPPKFDPEEKEYANVYTDSMKNPLSPTESEMTNFSTVSSELMASTIDSGYPPSKPSSMMGDYPEKMQFYSNDPSTSESPNQHVQFMNYQQLPLAYKRR